MNALVIAPHPDDEVLGCGGTVCLHAERGDRVAAVFLTSGELGLKHLPREKAWAIREQEATKAAKILGITATTFLRQPDWTLGDRIEPSALALASILTREEPGIIYLPHPEEWHPDHKAAIQILRHSLLQTRSREVTVRAYEVWTPLTTFDHAEDITTVMSRKIRALRAHGSQLKEFAYDRAIKGLNQYRGVMALRTKFAEVFANQAINDQPLPR